MCGSAVLLIAGLLALVGPCCSNSDNLALLLDTLRPNHRSVCDEDTVSLACPKGTSISIQVAQYGGDPPKDHPCAAIANRTCKLSNKVQYLLLQRVVEECQKKPSCVFSTNPGEDDPCPTSRKYVEVSYKCRPYEFLSINGCDDQVVKVSCLPHTRIAILNVQYGRTAYEYVTCPQPPGVPDETCSTPFATETVMRICQGKRRCQFTANRQTFDTSCKIKSRPHVNVIYACVPLGVLTERYETMSEDDDMSATGRGIGTTDGVGVKWRELNPSVADSGLDPNLPQNEETDSNTRSTTEDVLHKSDNEVIGESSLKKFLYIGAGIIILIILIAIIIAIYCYYTQKAKEKAKNGNMFTTEAPNVFSDTVSELDNDVDISHISGTFYDPVHPDMILYRDADGTRNTLRAMRPLSTVYPCATANMYGNGDYVPQPRELGRFPRSKSNEEEVDPDMMTSPKSIGAYSTSRFYYG